VAVLAAGLVLYLSRSARGSRGPVIKSLAVLPLENLSGDPTQEYFADGMTEAVIGRLSMIHGLRVVSRTSVLRSKTTACPRPRSPKL
jgi:TolB-like protein